MKRMRWLAALAAMALWYIPAKAQGQQITAGPFSKGGLLYVCPVPSGGTPCPSPSSIFSDSGLTQTLANPLSVPAQTTVTFYAAAGQYTLEMPASGYQQVTASSSGGGSPAVTAGNVVQSGLLGEYRILPTETAAAIKDYSGNGNNATGTVGTAPTITAVTGGALFAGTGAISLPTALNGAKTIQAFVSYFGTGAVNTFSSIVAGNSTTSVAVLFTGAQGLTNIPRFQDACSGTGISVAASSLMNGTAVVSFTAGDALYVNNTNTTTPGSALNNCTSQIPINGNYQLGGTSGGTPLGANSFFTGTIYYIVFYNRVLTTAELAQNVAVMTQAMAVRGVTASFSNPNFNTDLVVGDGDSLLAGLNGNFFPNMVLNGSWTAYNNAVQSSQISQIVATNGFTADPMLASIAKNDYVLWSGTNDCAASIPAVAIVRNLAAQLRGRKLKGFNTFVTSMVSRTGQDTCKDSLDTLLRTQWPTFADAFIDLASSASLGADGQSTNTLFFSDGAHPTTQANNNILLPVFQHAINAYNGNHDFTSGNTYTTSAPAATAITASSESTNTMTFTTTLNPPVGSCAVVTGVTPSGYNSTPANGAGNGCWQVLTASASQFTAYNQTTGLGAGTVFGTAAIPQEVDADVYATLGGSAASPNHSLQTCVGRTGTSQAIFRRITNTNAWTITPIQSTETINGGATFTTPVASASNNPIVKLESVAAAPATGGCTWKASLQ